MPSLPRFGLRRLMVLVALTGVALGLFAWMSRRSAAFQARASAHAERAFQVSLACRIDHKRLEHHEALADKYRRAARAPWLPVEPDPPGPD